MKDDIITPIPPKGDPWRDNELVHRMRIREDAERPLNVNLAETIELSEFLCGFAGIAHEK